MASSHAPRVIEFLRNHRREVFDLSVIAERTGLTLKQVKTAMNALTTEQNRFQFSFRTDPKTHGKVAIGIMYDRELQLTDKLRNPALWAIPKCLVAAKKLSENKQKSHGKMRLVA